MDDARALLKKREREHGPLDVHLARELCDCIDRADDDDPASALTVEDAELDGHLLARCAAAFARSDAASSPPPAPGWILTADWCAAVLERVARANPRANAAACFAIVEDRCAAFESAISACGASRERDLDPGLPPPTAVSVATLAMLAGDFRFRGRDLLDLADVGAGSYAHSRDAIIVRPGVGEGDFSAPAGAVDDGEIDEVAGGARAGEPARRGVVATWFDDAGATVAADRIALRVVIVVHRILRDPRNVAPAGATGGSRATQGTTARAVLRCTLRCLEDVCSVHVHIAREMHASASDLSTSVSGTDSLAGAAALAGRRVAAVLSAILADAAAEGAGVGVLDSAARAIADGMPIRAEETRVAFARVAATVRALLSNAASHTGQLRKRLASRESRVAPLVFDFVRDAAASLAAAGEGAESDGAECDGEHWGPRGEAATLRAALGALTVLTFKVKAWRGLWREGNPTCDVIRAAERSAPAGAVPAPILAHLCRVNINAGVVDADLRNEGLRKVGAAAIEALRTHWSQRCTEPHRKAVRRILGHEGLRPWRDAESPVAFASSTAEALDFAFDGADGVGDTCGDGNGGGAASERGSPRDADTGTARNKKARKRRRQRIMQKLRRRRAGHQANHGTGPNGGGGGGGGGGCDSSAGGGGRESEAGMSSQITSPVRVSSALTEPRVDFLCALDAHVVDDPVVSLQGIVFDRCCAERAADEEGEGATFECPVTGETVSIDELLEDESLAREVALFRNARLAEGTVLS